MSYGDEPCLIRDEEMPVVPPRFDGIRVVHCAGLQYGCVLAVGGNSAVLVERMCSGLWEEAMLRAVTVLRVRTVPNSNHDSFRIVVNKEWLLDGLRRAVHRRFEAEPHWFPTFVDGVEALR